MFQSCDIALDSLYCGKWKKFQSQTVNLTFDRTMPNVEFIRELFIYPTIYSNFKILDHLFFELSCLHTYTHTHTHTHRQTDTQRRVLYTSGLNRKYNEYTVPVIPCFFNVSIQLRIKVDKNPGRSNIKEKSLSGESVIRTSFNLKRWILVYLEI